MSALKALVETLDFQELANWYNVAQENDKDLADLSDDGFNERMSFLVRAHGYVVANKVLAASEELKDDDLKTFIKDGMADLKKWSTQPLTGDKVYAVVGFWGAFRKELMARLG
jgi:hypothetical protein